MQGIRPGISCRRTLEPRIAPCRILNAAGGCSAGRSPGPRQKCSLEAIRLWKKTFARRFGAFSKPARFRPSSRRNEPILPTRSCARRRDFYDDTGEYISRIGMSMLEGPTPAGHRSLAIEGSVSLAACIRSVLPRAANEFASQGATRGGQISDSQAAIHDLLLLFGVRAHAPRSRHARCQCGAGEKTRSEGLNGHDLLLT